MDTQEKSRLDFKRQFLLQNISDVKKEWYKFDEYREKLRFLFLTVWFGSIAIFVRDNRISWILCVILVIITLIFYYFEIYFSKESKIRIYRISQMEHWIMSSTDDEILNLLGPLANIVNIKKKFKIDYLSFLKGRVYIIYPIFFFLSIILKVLFDTFNKLAL